MKYEAEILAALEVAPRVKDLATLFEAGSEIQSILFVPTVEDLGVLLHEINLVQSLGVDQDVIAEITRHEGQHERAWKQIGSAATKFGVRLFDYEDSFGYINCFLPFMQVGWTNATQPTDLEFAAAAAHPINLSAQDISQISGYGFESVQAVAEHAIDNNRQGLKHVPVPLSYSSDATRRIFAPYLPGV